VLDAWELNRERFQRHVGPCATREAWLWCSMGMCSDRFCGSGKLGSGHRNIRRTEYCEGIFKGSLSIQPVSTCFGVLYPKSASLDVRIMAVLSAHSSVKERCGTAQHWSDLVLFPIPLRLAYPSLFRTYIPITYHIILSTRFLSYNVL
jgi:hypothetical protein